CSIALSPDGSKLAAARRFKDEAERQFSDVCLMDLNSREILWTWTAPGDHCVYSVAFAPEGASIVAADGQVRLLNAKTCKLERSLAVDKYFTMRAAFSPDGKNIAGAGGHEEKHADGHLTVWNVNSGEVLHNRTQLPSRVRCLAF